VFFDSPNIIIITIEGNLVFNIRRLVVSKQLDYLEIAMDLMKLSSNEVNLDNIGNPVFIDFSNSIVECKSYHYIDRPIEVTPFEIRVAQVDRDSWHVFPEDDTSIEQRNL